MILIVECHSDDAPLSCSHVLASDAPKLTIAPLAMGHHNCCYYKCDRPGTIFIGESGNPDTEWICAFHHKKWNADRARFLADGLPCELEEL